MTDNRAVCLLSQMYLPHFDDEEKEALTMAINSIQECTRQKAEIERLQNDVEVLGAELERYGKVCPKIKSEAIKEFAEKLKEYYPSIAKGIDYTAEEVLKG